MSQQNLDLVVSELDDADDLKLAQVIEDWYKRESTLKWERATTWSQSLHFLAGNQWIKYSQQERRWSTIPITDDNRHIDRPTTNHINRWIRTNAAGFTNKPSTSVEANSDEQADKTCSKISEVVQSYMWEEHQKTDQYYEIGLWSLITGIGIRKSFKKLTRNMVEDQYLKTVDSSPVSPFNITFDGLPSRFRDIGIVMETDIVRLETLKEEFGKKGEGYTGAVEELKEEKLVSTVLSIKEGLKDIVEGSQGYQNLSSDGETIKDSAIKKEVYVRPSRKYPKGRMIVVASGVVLYKGPSPYYYQDGRFWHPFTFVNFEKLPGNLWGMGLAQRLIPLQRRINSIDALIAYNRKTMAVPWILNPKNSGIKAGEKVGVPGQQIDYDNDGTGAKPEIVPGTALPVQILEERQICVEDGDRLSMAGDIRSGENPTGVNTLGQLQILTEQAEMSRSRQIEDWEKFIEESEKLDLLNFQSCYQAPIKQIYTNIKRFSKDITEFDWSQFVGADLRDNADVRVEKGSTLAKSRLMRQANIMALADKGYLGDFMVDPYKYKEFLAEFGLSNLFGDSNIDVTMAEKCIEIMMTGKYPPILEQYNPDIHIMVLAREMKKPKFLELPDPIRKLFMRRFDEFAKALSQFPTVAADQDPEEQGKNLQPQAV